MSDRFLCAYKGCTSKKDMGLNFFSLPLDRERCKLWLKACGRMDLMHKTPEALRHYTICERHFEEKSTSTDNHIRLRSFASAGPIPNFPKQPAKETKIDKSKGISSPNNFEAVMLDEPLIQIIKCKPVTTKVAEDPLKLSHSGPLRARIVSSTSILETALKNTTSSIVPSKVPQHRPLILRKTAPPPKEALVEQIKLLSVSQAAVLNNLKFPLKPTAVVVNNRKSTGIKPSTTVDLTLSDDDAENLSENQITKSNNAPSQNSFVNVKQNTQGTTSHHVTSSSKNLSSQIVKVVPKRPEADTATTSKERITNDKTDGNKTLADSAEIYVPIRNYCAFINCSTQLKNVALRKYRFPREPNLSTSWRKAAGIPDSIENKDLEPLFVCGKHFTASNYTERGTLKPATVPQACELYVDKKAIDANPHWLRKVRCTKKKYPSEEQREEEENGKEKRPPLPSGPPIDFVQEVTDLIQQSIIAVNKSEIKKPDALFNLQDVNLMLHQGNNSAKLPQKCCVKHCTVDEFSGALFKFPTFTTEYQLWIKAVENRAYISPEMLATYRSKQICWKHFEPKFLHNHVLRSNAIPTLYLVDATDDTETERDTDIVWQKCPTTLVDPAANFSKGVKRRAILGEDCIEFPNLKWELKFGKDCPKKGLNKFPYKIYRLPYNHVPIPENVKVRHQVQIHTAIVIDDDDQSERAAVDMICDILKQNDIPPRRKRVTNKRPKVQ